MTQARARGEGRIFPRGKLSTLWIAWWADGREYRETARTTDLRVAQRKLRDKLAAKDKGETYVPGAQRVTLGRLADMLSEHHETAGTQSARRIAQCMRHIVEHFGTDRRATKVTYALLEGYVRAR